jgi:hypothetical protein
MTASNGRGEDSGAIDEHEVAGSGRRPLMDAVGGALTPPIHRLARANGFADVVGAATRLEVWMRRRAARHTTWLLHQYNVPSADDIRKVRAQLETAEARMRDVWDRLEDREPASKPRCGAPRPVRRTASQSTSRARKPSSGSGRGGSDASAN